jgi:hypothetical protein
MAVNDEEHDDENEVICRNISRLTFKFITRIIQQVRSCYSLEKPLNDFLFKDNIDKLILIECLTALQTTLCALPVEHIRENSLSLADLINEMKMMLTTHQLADTSIEAHMDE